MGGGASIPRLAEELGKPLDASDVNTPRGVSAKQEVERLRRLIHEVQGRAEKIKPLKVEPPPRGQGRVHKTPKHASAAASEGYSQAGRGAPWLPQLGDQPGAVEPLRPIGRF
jgi:hypothetical protein